MTIPFFRGFDKYDLWTAALVARALNLGDAKGARDILNTVEPYTVSTYRSTSLPDPNYAVCCTENFVLVGVSGTEGFGGWMVNVLGSAQTSNPPIPGNVAAAFAGATFGVYDRIAAMVEAQLPGKRLVLIGHSLGGAVAQCLLAMFSGKGQLDSVAIVLGCPRVGDQAFADAVGPKVMRVENTDDAITALPPARWAGLGSQFPRAGPGPIAEYVHAGTVKTMDASGTLFDGNNGQTLNDTILAFSVWDVPTHHSDYYVLRFSYGLEKYPIPPAVEYDDPASLVAASYKLAPLPAPKRSSSVSYLTQAIMFFRANNGVQEGWEEAFYLSSDVPSALSLLKNTIIPQRIQFMSNQAEIHAYRAARADGTRLSKTTKPLAPFVGQLPSPVNEFGDCMLYKFFDADGRNRQWPFRAIPDGWIEGKKLTAAGIAAVGNIDVFGNIVMNNGGALKIPYGGNPKLAISALANDPAAGGPIKVTVAIPHGLADGNLVRITGLAGFPYLRGEWRITVVDALNFKLVGSQRYNCNTTTVTAQYQLISYVASNFSSLEFNAVSFRDTGTPFGRERGKQSAVVLHH